MANKKIINKNIPSVGTAKVPTLGTTKITESKAITDDSKLSATEDENKILRTELIEMKKMIDELQKISNESKQIVVNNGSILDRLCTLIHLKECVSGLDTPVKVNGVVRKFSKFGESAKYRFQDMQTIVSKYRKYFDSGVFMLGEDCNEFAEDFSIEQSSMPISVQQFRMLHDIPDNEFETIIKSINGIHRANIARTWCQRYDQNISGYDNIEKIRILNKYTDGLLKDFLIKIATE